MDLNKDYLRYVLMPGRFPPDHLKNEYTATYNMWKSVWLKAFQDLDNVNQIFSDDFTRQDFVGTLFYKDQPIGSLFYNKVDLTQEVWRDDGYFKAWPKDLLLELGQIAEGRKIIVSSYFTLAESWRRERFGFRAKEFICAMGIKQLIHSDCEYMVGTMRNDRGMNELLYRQGADPLRRNLILHGVEVDLIILAKQKLMSFKYEAVDDLMNHIWANSFPEKNQIQKKKAA